MVKLERHVVNGKEISLEDAVIQACAGAEVISQEPQEEDHMANGRVEMGVREVKRQCRTLRISAEQNTSVRITDDSPPFSWLPRFCSSQVMNKMRNRHEQGENW